MTEAQPRRIVESLGPTEMRPVHALKYSHANRVRNEKWPAKQLHVNAIAKTAVMVKNVLKIMTLDYK